MSLVLATRALGIAGFAASLSAPYCLRPPLSHADEKSQRLMAYFGRGVYLTVQTNAVNLVYFTVSLSATLTGWASLQSATDAGFPLAFALGSLLTPLYYSADHFNPMHVERNRQHKEKGFRWCELADHVEHAHATPLLLLEVRQSPLRRALEARHLSLD